jgi:hypothetical protein
MPNSSFTRFSQGNAFVPLPSKPPGLVRGFHNLLFGFGATGTGYNQRAFNINAG